ncbi:MAG: lipocalin family protein [Alistipes sp.]|nr:lipocalin family protein [Alistipes sp.]MDO5496614.1 lipocalin family protein [Alistipes sp.]
MKQWFKVVFLTFVVLAFAVSCSDDSEPQPEYLEVTRGNIAGVWKLESWMDAPLSDGSYVYIEFNRSDRSYTMWQNIDSFQLRKLTGLYWIEIDEELGAIIRGSYDHGVGEWAHRYIVSDLTEGTMVWTAKDNESDVSVYVRCELPEEFREQ